MKYLNATDVECIMFFKVFDSVQDKVELVEYLYHNGLISTRTKEALLKELRGN